MRVYGCHGVFIGVYGFLWVYMRVYGCLWVLMSVYGYFWVFVSLYGCLGVSEVYGYLWVSWVSMAVYGSLWMFMDIYECLCHESIFEIRKVPFVFKILKNKFNVKIFLINLYEFLKISDFTQNKKKTKKLPDYLIDTNSLTNLSITFRN